MWFIRECVRWIDWFVCNIPGSLGMGVRRVVLQKRFLHCGERFVSAPGLDFEDPKKIRLGSNVTFVGRVRLRASDGILEVASNVSINDGVLLDASGGRIFVGDGCLIGPNVVLRASNHVFSRTDVPIRAQGHAGGEIILEEDVWLAANVVVLPRVTIGRGAVVGAGAIVTRSIPPGAVAVGSPARVIRIRGAGV